MEMEKQIRQLLWNGAKYFWFWNWIKRKLRGERKKLQFAQQTNRAVAISSQLNWNERNERTEPKPKKKQAEKN